MRNTTSFSIAALPRIDVVTVCKDAASLLEKTLASVAAQTFHANRYIVIDGGSTDGTNVVVSRYTRTVSYFISEPDKGIGHAMNKGLAQCSGDYVLFLHAGDCFLASSALEEAATMLAKTPTDILACPVILAMRKKRRIAKVRGFNKWMYLKTGIPHQGAFISRSLFNALGGFDENLRIAMDYEFFFRSYRYRAGLCCHPKPLTIMAEGGISWRRDWPALKDRLAEERIIHLRFATSPIAIFAYQIYWMLYPLYKRIAKT